MGVDLKLFPLYDNMTSGTWFAVSCLETSRNYALQEAVRALDTNRVPDDFSSYLGPDGEWKASKVDAYGQRLTYIEAGPLAVAFAKVKEKDPDFWHWNTAILRLLKALPKDWKIVLYWH